MTSTPITSMSPKEEAGLQTSGSELGGFIALNYVWGDLAVKDSGGSESMGIGYL